MDLFPKRFDRGWDGTICLQKEPDVATLMTERVFDFFTYSGSKGRLREMVFWFAHAFKFWAAGKNSTTHRERFSSFRNFFIFLDSSAPQCLLPDDIDNALLDHFDRWIRSHSNWGLTLRRRVWSFPLTLRQLLADLRPSLVRHDLPLRPYIVRGEVRRKTPKRVLSKKEIGHICRVCRELICKQRALRSAAEHEMDEARKAGYDGVSDPNWDDRGAILLFRQTSYLNRTDINGTANYDRLRTKILVHRRFGATKASDFDRCFAPDGWDLMPYLILIALYLGINSESLLYLESDCLRSTVGKSRMEADFLDVLKEERDQVFWLKGRAVMIQRRSFQLGNEFHPPHLIREWLAASRHMRSIAAKTISKRLFLYDFSRKGPTWLRSSAMSRLLSTFCLRHGLPKFTITDFRVAAVNYGYERSGGDLTATAALVNHKSRNTTKNVYFSGPAKRVNDIVLGKIVTEMTKWLRQGGRVAPIVVPARVSVQSPLATMSKLWLSAFRDPRHLVCGDIERAARILQMRNHLAAARGSVHRLRWDVHYSQLYEILNASIVPQIRPSDISEATRLSEILPALPPVE